MDIETLQEILAKASQAGCRTVRVRHGDHKFSAILPPAFATEENVVTAPSEAIVETAEVSLVKPITAPQVGRLTLSDQVKVGGTVAKGDRIGRIEALSISNDVVANLDGEIAEILVEQESVVDFGKPLLLVKCL